VGVGDRKNPWISVKAVEILREKLNLKLVITGGRLDIKRDFVEVVGKLSLKEYVELLSRAKALVLPSSYETFSYAALEAMACGTPVVVSNAIPDEVVVSGFNGIRVNSLEPMEWAKALENVVTNEGLWLKLSRNGLDFAKRFDYLEIAREYINLIREIEAKVTKSTPFRPKIRSKREYTLKDTIKIISDFNFRKSFKYSLW
jgi:glycosyltransferase involved in cell wall biosynthesis